MAKQNKKFKATLNMKYPNGDKETYEIETQQGSSLIGIGFRSKGEYSYFITSAFEIVKRGLQEKKEELAFKHQKPLIPNNSNTKQDKQNIN
jgi:hypothetical protein